MQSRSLLILVLIGVSPTVWASGLGEEVTEDTFLAALEESHPASRALAGVLGIAEGERLRASLLDDPRLEISREAPEDMARETIWGIAWTPPIDGRRQAAIAAAEAGVDVERHRLDRRRLELRLELREAYAFWAVSEARGRLLDKHSGRLEMLARWMRHRAEAGEESRLAAERLAIAYTSSKVALAEVRAAAAAGRERAGAWLDASGWDLSVLQPQLPQLPEAPADLDTEARPDVRAARSRVEQTESRKRLSRRVVEAPELSLGWKSIENDLDDGRGDFEGAVFAVGWKIPLFDRRRADRLAADSAVEAALASEEWTTRSARSELAAVLAAYNELRKSADGANGEVKELDEVARAATASFEAGESTVTDLLDTLGSILDARLRSLDLYNAALDAHRQLELAAGRALTSGDLS